MRLYTFLLLSLLLAATVIHANDDEQVEDEDEYLDGETPTTTTTISTRKSTKGPKKVTKRPKMNTDDYPQCQTTTIKDRPAYLCERIVDGEKQTFGIAFEDDNKISCGEIRDEKIDGPGVSIYLGDKYQQQTYCGPYREGEFDGQMFWYFYNSKSIEMSAARGFTREGISVAYWIKSGQMSRFWYEGSVCKSRINYYDNGEEKSRDAYSCTSR